MNWTRESDYHMVSECKRFTICKYAIDGVWFYEAHKGKRMLATRLPSFNQARAVCTQQEAV